jgi:hypothetical protein
LAFSYWFDSSLVSQLREDLLLCSSYLPLGVPNELFLQAINEFSGAVAGEKEDFCKGSLSRTIFYFVFCFALFYSCLHCFIKYTKKLVSFIVAFIYLLLILKLKFVLLSNKGEGV